MSKTLHLSDKNYLSQGNVRTCYIHPQDSSKVIKVQKKHTAKNKQQNKIESICYSDLEKENIQNYDSSKAQSFEDVVKKSLLSKKEQLQLLEELKSYLFTNNILFIDVSLANILCKKTAKDSYRLIIIDGLGARRFGIKFFIQRKCSYLKKKKIQKQWQKLLKNFYDIS